VDKTKDRRRDELVMKRPLDEEKKEAFGCSLGLVLAASSRSPCKIEK